MGVIFHWIKDHVGNLLAGGGSAATILLVTFKDSLREFWQEWHADRRVARERRQSETSRGDLAINKLISVLEKNLTEQHVTIEKMQLLLERMVVANELSLNVQRVVSTQMSDFDKRLLRIEGAINAGGRFQQ